VADVAGRDLARPARSPRRRIRLTEKGEAIRAQVISGRRQLLEDSLAGLQPDAAAIATLEAIAERLVRRL
jgi:DNA-binding MarR family transcriptional regulator